MNNKWTICWRCTATAIAIVLAQRWGATNTIQKSHHFEWQSLHRRVVPVRTTIQRELMPRCDASEANSSSWTDWNFIFGIFGRSSSLSPAQIYFVFRTKTLIVVVVEKSKIESNDDLLETDAHSHACHSHLVMNVTNECHTYSVCVYAPYEICHEHELASAPPADENRHNNKPKPNT